MDDVSKIDEIHATMQIHALKARYFRFFDTKDWEGLRGLFTPDAQLFYPEMSSEPVDLDTAMEAIPPMMVGCVSIHHGHMPEIEILSPDSARGIWAMEEEIFWPANDTVLGVEYLHGYGHYHEDYQRRDGQWLIHRIKLTRLRRYAVEPAKQYL